MYGRGNEKTPFFAVLYSQRAKIRSFFVIHLTFAFYGQYDEKPCEKS